MLWSNHTSSTEKIEQHLKNSRNYICIDLIYWVNSSTIMMLNVDLLVLSFCLGLGTGYKKSSDSIVGKRQYQIQNGPCSYTFLLPEQENCQTSNINYNNQVQKDGPLDDDESAQRLEQLEIIMENNTQWLIKLESYIQDSMKQDMIQIQQTAVHNHTATMIQMGANLLSQTAEQTRKLTNVEAQVINHTTRLERQLLENSLSTNKLEKQLIVQTNEINKLNDRNSFLEKKVEDLEKQRQEELKILQDEKKDIQALIQKQTAIIGQLEQQLLRVSSNNTILHHQQLDLLDTMNNLIHTISMTTPQETKPVMMQDTPSTYTDCAAVFKSGNTETEVYTLTIPNTTLEAFCDMETEGGGWTVLQKRFDGRVDFHRTWQEYKMGFGEPSGEFWLGNDFVSTLTNKQPYKLRIHLSDWEGNSGYSEYDQFSLDSEAQNYRIHLKGYSGTAGKISSIGQPGSDFSTKDADNDKCVCKCSQLTTGGWWFDACGPSNLNGMYYQHGQNSNRFNGIKWYYWKGSGYSLKSTTMMIRPADFSSSR
ncbi:angiopoietin-2a isoform X2 [Thalassophryne amazonica]|uniref:angiopoietin-2a isoform X2 n=1 Tax=Thalassophryne amazonica TaxID=390379 RepID=UPI0014724F5A|nr:angiopoietin-2a isoform X2 [Thalassophryne amazonica]